MFNTSKCSLTLTGDDERVGSVKWTEDNDFSQEWNAAVEKLKSEALEILLSKDHVEKEHLQLSNQKLNRLQEEFGQLVAERKTWLKKANDFFNSANKVSAQSSWSFQANGAVHQETHYFNRLEHTTEREI